VTQALPIDQDLIERWRQRQAEALAEARFVEWHRERDERRRKTLTEMQALLSDFLGGRASLEAFRSAYDRRSRGEWDVFGFKGNSGAMFINTLVKHIEDPEEVTRRLHHVLPVPASEEDGRTRLQAFSDWLEGWVRRGDSGRRKIQPFRAAFSVSAWWHIQDTEQWPVFYQSARDAFEADGVYEDEHDDPTGSYFAFRRVYLHLAKALGLSVWEFEHVCSWIEDKEEFAQARAVESRPRPVKVLPSSRRIWLVAPGRNADHWNRFREEGVIGIGWPELGDLSKYPDRDAIHQALRRNRDVEPHQDSLACWEFARVMQPGDEVFAKKGRYLIVGHGIVKSGYRFEEERGELPSVRDVEWTKSGSWRPREGPMVMKTLTEISGYPRLVGQIRTALGLEAEEGGEVDDALPAAAVETYDLDAACEDLFVPRSWIRDAMDLLEAKKNLVLQGPPGTGKTYIASRLARVLVGGVDPDRICSVQFHQSYSYEDFVQGYRPTASGHLERVDGPFLRFCDRALQDLDRPYVLIIDEINRGNLSKIFGELMLLIEADKRALEWGTTLTYARGDEPAFYVPPNVHLIGSMNTADRSLALVDYALRRRFVFLDVGPCFDSERFAEELVSRGIGSPMIATIRRRMKELNDIISSDRSLGPGFRIGHSFFCSRSATEMPDEEWYQRVIRTEIVPLLREYWFDDAERADEAAARLLSDD